MEGNKVISVEHLWKEYKLGVDSSRSFGKMIRGLFGRNGSPEDRAQENDRSIKGTSDYVWALQDICFDVKQGEVLSVIGKNGAGKSTLLKLISRVTYPTRGEIKIKGRIASLLEVGTGFHPDLTGRENIFLNGAILGMTKHEIRSKFDEIVAFSGVERYIDTPVKKYSSGMYVRLAFAVAAHLEPEILIVDEVLAVGDVEFQKKCLGKMKDVSGEGRTVIFVSHNMAAIRSFCTRAVLLEKGKVSFNGAVDQAINRYISGGIDTGQTIASCVWDEKSAPGGDEVRYLNAGLLNTSSGEFSSTFFTSTPIRVQLTYQVKKAVQGARLVLSVRDTNGVIIFNSTNHAQDSGLKQPGNYQVECLIPGDLLNKGRYEVYLHMGIPGVKVLVQGEPFLRFDVVTDGSHGSLFPEDWAGVVAPKLKWSNLNSGSNGIS